LKFTELTAALLEKFFIGGCGFLTANKEVVDALNVFPVPDGDTGTNMSLTMNSAVKDLTGLSSAAQVAHTVSRGALMGARGNSGVILSQLFRGFAQGVGDKKSLSAADFAFSLQKGVELAYKSVMKPVEGTILTVSREVAAAAVKEAKQNEDVFEVITYALEQGQAALNNTPNQLPVLKQAGVVDAGGKGFLMILEGGVRALQGEKIEAPLTRKEKRDFPLPGADQLSIPFQYCTEFIIKGDRLSVETIKSQFQDQGDSLLVVGTEDLVKVHVHTNHPGEILEFALTQGSLHDIKIDNMKEQHRETMDLTGPPAEEKCAVVVVAAGEGLAEIFRSLGVATVINGGQTMNPSAEDLLTAIEKVAAREVVVLPNNRNIILTAQQAQSLSEKSVAVVPTKSLAQGLAAMLAFDQDQTAAHNREEMTKAFAHVKTGEVTYAVRDSSFNGFSIKEKDILGLVNGSIEIIGQDVNQVVLDVIEKMVEPDHELITLFYGHHVTEEEANAVAARISEDFPNVEVEVHYGGQPLYYYLISLE